MGQPKRIQRRRAKGWRMPEGAIVVDRSSKWGNPFKAGQVIRREDDLFAYVTTPEDDPRVKQAISGMASLRVPSTAKAVELYAWWIIEQPYLMAAISELRGKDLACWCKPDAPSCHADVLLDLANGRHG